MALANGRRLGYRTSRVSFLGNYSLALLLIVFLALLLPFLGSQYIEVVGIAVVLLAFILAAEPEAEIFLRQYLITNAEVIRIEGIISKKTFSIPYQSVADIRVIKGAIGRIFNFGDVMVKGIKEDIIFKGVRNPEVIGKVIENKIALMKRPSRPVRMKIQADEEDNEKAEDE
jgi:uncharacterized membrane protein YdbT with pleckstrin-like domain